jgi:hypothetical protein
MLLKKKVGWSIAWAAVDSFRIIGEIYNSVFDSFIIFSTWIFFIEHTIFPTHPWCSAETSWTFVSLKLTTIMGVFHKKFHVLGNMYMNDNGSVIFNIELKVVQIFNSISKAFYSSLKSISYSKMLILWFFVHIFNCLKLKFCHSCFLIYFQTQHRFLNTRRQMFLHLFSIKLNPAVYALL